jgi:transglutaminase-like putative cysteine protease
MERFFGNVWEPTATTESGGGDLSEIGPPPGLADDIAAELATVEVEVGTYTSRWIPAPYPAVSLTGFDGDAEWLRETLAMRSTDSSISAQSYSVDFLEVDPTGAQLVRGGSLDVSEQTLELPELPENIVATADEVAGAARTPFEKAVALQSYLRASPFRYSEETPVEQDFDGTSVEAISAFLEVKAGYCVHYASAMAVMARELGIPSRLAVGFQPGAAQTVDGETVRTLTTDDLHAWPELFIEGVGWMRFEPTPGRGSVPAFDSTPVDDPATPEDESVVEATATPAPSATPGARPLDDDAAEDPVAVAETSSSAVAWIVAFALAVLVAVRAGRVRRIRRDDGAADAAWSELRDTARDHGWSAPESETPRVFVERLVDAIDDSDGVLRAFRASVESSAFAEHPGPLTVDALRDARRVIAESTPLRGRVAALLLPASLVYRWKPDD